MDLAQEILIKYWIRAKSSQAACKSVQNQVLFQHLWNLRWNRNNLNFPTAEKKQNKAKANRTTQREEIEKAIIQKEVWKCFCVFTTSLLVSCDFP